MSQFSAPNYEIPRTSGVCISTGRTLEPGETYYAVLIDVPPSEERPQSVGLERVDVSSQAWDEGFRPAHLFSYWKSTIPEPSAKKKLFVDDAVLMNLLRRLGDTDQPQRLAFRYVLALILMRKKLLRYDGAVTKTATVHDEPVEQTWWLVTPKVDVSKGRMGKWNEEDTLEVLDPGLDEAGIEQVTQQLGEILEAEL